jgi:hypothetical protein
MFHFDDGYTFARGAVITSSRVPLNLRRAAYSMRAEDFTSSTNPGEHMKRLIATAALAAAAFTPCLATADDDNEGRSRDSGDMTIAVIGDWPYNQLLLDNASLLINSVNSDRKVSLVMHVGDIHSGSLPCTGAGLAPIPAGSNPGWNEGIYNLFQQFRPPVVYTPGDNEWTDCHKKKQFSSGAPLNELAAVRGLFFRDPGFTLGAERIHVSTQARDFDRKHPADAQFVENVMFERNGVVFATLNMPGSNNDGLTWTAPFTNETARVAEAATRTLADLRWLDAAFDRAEEEHARAMVIGLQADMWDPAAIVAGGDGLGNYTAFVHQLAQRALRFGKPVLLINGDSHVYGADQPLADPASASGKIHGTPAVPNLTRITVQGSTTAPAEWLKLTINPESAQVFSWENVPYCKDPLSTCKF